MTMFGPFGFETLMDPWALLLLAVPIALFFFEAFAHSAGVMRVSTGEAMAGIHRVTSTMKRRVPPLLRVVALALLIIALARPLQGMTPVKERADVVDIMLCVDVSGSMLALDFVDRNGNRRDRLYITKAAVRDFIDSRKAKPSDRFGLDRLGLVLYAGYAWTQSPLTLDYGVLEHELDLAQVDQTDPSKQGTAIGSALGLAVSRLRKSEAESKVIILLTDGRNNRGELDPVTAAGIARDYDMRVYTVGAGTEGVVPLPQQTPFGTRYAQAMMDIDEETLQQIAEITGGRYYRATDTESLKQAYEEINQLEATEIELGDYYEYEEGFMPYVVAGAVLMMVSALTRRMWFDPIP